MTPEQQTPESVDIAGLMVDIIEWSERGEAWSEWGHEDSLQDALRLVASHVERLSAEREGLRGALQSIANNSCCGPCQEAKLVARAALSTQGRLEVASEGSRELDAAVEVAIRNALAARSGLSREHWADWLATREGWVEDPHTSYKADPVTTSLDAALALAERVHPGFHAALYTSDGDKSRQAMITVPTRKDGPFNATAATIPLALCIAILKATAASSVGIGAADEPKPKGEG